MHPAVKLLIGIILLVIPLGLYAYEFMYPGAHFFQGTPYELHLRASLWTVLQGIIPPFVLVVGLFIIWLELDEWRIEKELKMEEKKEKKGKKK
ncbi:MAG: hypothetical protein QMD36_00970 [Candidatus Aenigmarchaeota archaeon]|nr:hypothetical protein [Candidatus Aenigmarchaeota archaeon]